MNKLSAIVLTLNEEKFLPGCLQSLNWVDELVVVDSGSKDKTLEIAKSFDAKIIKSKWLGFPKQRNLGAKHASGDWLLYVDSDERVTKELKHEIKKLLNQNEIQHNSYKIPHRNFIMGKWLKHGGWYKESQHRLIKKSKFSNWQGDLHEHPVVEGTIGILNSDLIHLTHRGMGWMLTKTIRYTKMEAQLRLKANHPKIKVRHFFSAPLREFYTRAIVKSGWRDGLIGWLEIIYQTFNHFLIMSWLWEMQQKDTMEDTYSKLDEELRSEL